MNIMSHAGAPLQLRRVIDGSRSPPLHGTQIIVVELPILLMEHFEIDKYIQQ